jgi:hypothetical protein
MDADCRRSLTMEEHWRSASERFENTFVNNSYGLECDVCERDLKPMKSYERMKKHHLPKLVKRVDSFCGRRSSSAAITEAQRINVDDDHDKNENSRRPLLLVSAIKAQNFMAHAEDTETDFIMNKSDYLIISETCMDDATPGNVSGFELKTPWF